MADQQVAMLIDFENVGLTSIQWLFDQLSELGRITIKRVYADWSLSKNRKDEILELGIEAIHLFRSTSSGKNSSDLRLAIDAVDLLYQSPVDTFVIVSSDSDFVPLVIKLRAAGKTVIGAGESKKAPRTLVSSCDRYHFLDRTGISAPSAKRPTAKKAQADGNLLLRAVNSAMDEQGRIVGSKLHQTLQRLDPSFNFSSLGHSTFTKYLETCPEVRVTRPKGPGDVIVELSD